MAGRCLCPHHAHQAPRDFPSRFTHGYTDLWIAWEGPQEECLQLDVPTVTIVGQDQYTDHGFLGITLFRGIENLQPDDAFGLGFAMRTIRGWALDDKYPLPRPKALQWLKLIWSRTQGQWNTLDDWFLAGEKEGMSHV